MRKEEYSSEGEKTGLAFGDAISEEKAPKNLIRYVGDVCPCPRTACTEAD
jgi:hypothetical protein